ncbi:assimilatory sulfite reductase (NADPH) flavoprotein subunit [Flavihumibacter stibioxidans]|uniref:Sulfite reductase [NADPH] flavoprotein, alpha-component n=1 Tax=Flavihumibacter stibioxidans TaxID=1834163 RepID=A0ABR7M409_9BACT|nr:assimilatory sulfite reductase (NADPH) flavoprotein subunit [Flavihumibacter stibioxidans]MBC6489353.1 sulfite reductase [NADPH] flavoprotein, alpha-component [Flavihumibacter stibioxidans]
MSASSIGLPANIFSPAEQVQVQDIIHKFSQQQLQWLAGYLTGLQHSNQQLLQLINRIPVTQESLTAEPLNGQDSITVLYGSKSGNSKKVAKNLHDKLIARGFTSVLQDMNQYQGNRLKDEKWLLVVVSTHGEGDPPPAAEDLHAFINSRKAPALDSTRYAVLALGDKSYASFCQTGRDFDTRLSALKAIPILSRVEADVDYEETAEAWIESVLAKIQENFGSAVPSGLPNLQHTSSVNQDGQLVSGTQIKYSRKNPFRATILENIRLNGRGSAKQTHHVEISLEGSGLSYQPGDTLGIWVENELSLVNELTEFKRYNTTDPIVYKDTTLSLEEFLLKHAELTTISGSFLSAYCPFILDPAVAHSLKNILADKETLSSFVYGRDILDILVQFPADISAQELAAILLPLQPRLYSIASSLSAHPEEVHITVGRVEYEANQRVRRGVASNFITGRLQPGQEVSVFIEENESFRLPANGDTAVIMVGPGTGIAPFRAFVEERAESGFGGHNWLFFGDQHFTTDFLYQTEWQRFIRQGALSRMNTAFSRDGQSKLYVQHRMQQHASELFSWLENGAHFYVCGDARKMARDVKQTLIGIVCEQGRMEPEAAVEYVKQMVKTGRYQEDTY